MRTPSGRPASRRASTSMNDVSGVSCAGLSTIVQPAAIAGPILRVPIASGKFHGVMSTQGPTGSLEIMRRFLPSVRLHEVAAHADGLLGEPAEEFGAVGHLALRFGERLAHLRSHDGRDVVGALVQQVEGAAEDLRALTRSGRRPAGLCVPCGVDGVERIGLGRVGDRRDDGSVRGIADLQRAAAFGVAPLAVDEQPGLELLDDRSQIHVVSS